MKYYTVIDGPTLPMFTAVVDTDTFPVLLRNAAALCALMPSFSSVCFDYVPLALYTGSSLLPQEHVEKMDTDDIVTALQDLLICDDGWHELTEELAAHFAVAQKFDLPWRTSRLCASEHHVWLSVTSKSGNVYNTEEFRWDEL